MGKGAWAADRPVVSVPPGGPPKAVTLVVPYYESPVFFRRQLESWRALVSVAEQAHGQLSVIVVDDGSPQHPASDVLSEYGRPSWLRLFRIKRDVPWNWLAARNIGAHHAEDGWLILTDMDHEVPPDALRGLVEGAHDPDVVYAFSRREHTGEVIHSHSASFFMTRAMFWRVGGYDERLSGVYGTDGAYRKRLMHRAQVSVLSDALVRHEYVADASVTAYDRKTPAMRAARARRFALLPSGPPRVLSFSYDEVTT